MALVHDWLVTFAGSERVLWELSRMYPDAPIYTSVYDKELMSKYFPPERVKTSFLQFVPGAIRRHRSMLPLMPLAFQSFDLRKYDLIISSSHACSKGINVPQNTIHVCYCHTPIRYAWSHIDEYLKAIRNGIKRWAAKMFILWLRQWDFAMAQRVTYFVANSRETARRIGQYYNREAAVVHPPVYPGKVAQRLPDSEGYFLCLGRLVTYKRIDLAILACNRLKVPLVVAGDGPEMESLRKIAGDTVQMLGEVSEAEKICLLQGARALLFCGYEDFGIVMAESLLNSCPVIAYGDGGALDIIKPGTNGLFFNEQSVEAVCDAIEDFTRESYDPAAIYDSGEHFLPEHFRIEMAQAVDGFVHKESTMVGHQGELL